MSGGRVAKAAWPVWLLTGLAGFVIVAMTGCAPSAPGRRSETKGKPISPAPSQRAAIDSSTKTTAGEPRHRSPQQVAALDRVHHAKGLIAEGNYLRAISELEQTLTMDATNPQIYFYLAQAHYGLAHFEESLDFVEVAASFMDEKNASFPQVLILQGDNLRSLGRLPQARQSYERALAIDPRNETAARRLRLLSKQS